MYDFPKQYAKPETDLAADWLSKQFNGKADHVSIFVCKREDKDGLQYVVYAVVDRHRQASVAMVHRKLLEFTNALSIVHACPVDLVVSEVILQGAENPT